MIRLQATVTAFALLLICGVLHGLRTERWQPSAALEQAAAQVGRVSLAVGDWHGRAETDDIESFDMAGARRYWTRTYTHRQSQAKVLAILMCGRAGRMSVHTPEVCYRGAGFEMPDDAVRFSMTAEPTDTFWTATFAKTTGLGSSLRLFWAWNAQGTWEAPDNPRWQFRGAPFLYKLYVSHDLAGTGDHGAATDAGADFLRAFLPELERSLFSTGS
jgi:hypothetical protein